MAELPSETPTDKKILFLVSIRARGHLWVHKWTEFDSVLPTVCNISSKMSSRICLVPKMRSLLVILIVVSGLCAIVVHTHPAGSKNGGSVKAPDPESLPPDTFRKLAQARYQRGDKAENRLQRKFFYNGNITCNDGSVAGYYIRRNYSSKRWIIFLEGKNHFHNFLINV